MAATQCIALVRGINVGKAKRVAMADLRKLFEKLGYEAVRTLLNSGNVVFTSSSDTPVQAVQRIERTLTDDLGVSARVTVLTARELKAIVAENPLLKIADNPSRLLVAVVRERTDLRRLEPLTRQKWGAESLHVGSRVAYVWCPESILESPLFEAVSRALRDGVTARNWATVLKLHDLIRSK